ncbi:MAG: iron hydrogenase [Clostridiales bacterium]|nr:iron hydrogenase [Clostridiales bacterium]
MQTFNDLYTRLLKAAAENKTQRELEEIQKDEFDPHQLDCLLHPRKYASVWKFGDCDCSGEEENPCVSSCLFRAIKKDKQGKVIIDIDLCAGCSVCIDACKSGKLTGSKDILPTLEAVKNSTGPVYAMIAPAFIGQFSQNVTPGKLRSAFKKIGFAGMVEVALFADALTLKEALEFDKKIIDDKDYMITSCCCPIWIAMIRKIYKQFIPHVPGAVSPMVACGRSIKLLEPNSTTVFIGPCIAKKAEAREQDIADAVDFVLTFEEIQDIFDAFHVDPSVLEDDQRDHSSKSGRIYARKGGVSEAVQNTVNKLSPNRTISVKAQQADGVPACKEMLSSLREGKITANFLEGMGCVGGCVGGPKAVLNWEEGRDNVNQYSSLAAYETPVDNPFVQELLKRLGIESVESLLEDTEIFTRHF